jgi:hypothetical protein
MGLDLVPRSPLNSVQMPADANRGRLSSKANHTTSFFLVCGFGSGAYSAKLFAGTRQRFSGFNHICQCGEEVLRMLVTGGPAIFGGVIDETLIAEAKIKGIRERTNLSRVTQELLQGWLAGTYKLEQ